MKLHPDPCVGVLGITLFSKSSLKVDVKVQTRRIFLIKISLAFYAFKSMPSSSSREIEGLRSPFCTENL